MTPIVDWIGTCPATCECLYRCELVGLDASYLYILARILGNHGASSNQFIDILGLHSCGGTRRVVTSTTCVSECYRTHRENGEPVGHEVLPDIIEGFSEEMLLKCIEALDDSAHIDAFRQSKYIDGETKPLDDGERTLLAAMDQIDAFSYLITEDEDAFDIIKDICGDGATDVQPISTVAVWRHMYTCSALSEAAIICLTDGLKKDIRERRSDMKDRKRQRKTDDINQLINFVGGPEAMPQVQPTP